MQIALCIFGVVLGGSWAGTTSSYQHRTTSLDELKEIDSYVATGLPLFDHGFFVSTGMQRNFQCCAIKKKLMLTNNLDHLFYFIRCIRQSEYYIFLLY